MCEEKCASESNPKPRPKPKPSSADVVERGVAWIGVRSSGKLCVDEEYAKGGGSHSLLHKHILEYVEVTKLSTNKHLSL